MSHELETVERNRLAALVAGDVKGARRFHHRDFQLITPRGVALSLEQYLDEIRSGALRYLRWDPEVIGVRQSEDMGAVRYRATIEMLSDGAPIPVFRTWHTDVYVRQDGRWAVLWSQATSIV